MAHIAALDRRAAALQRRHVPWLTIALLAVLLNLADEFWLTSLQGAIGAVSLAQHPFVSWLRSSALLLPLFGLAVLWGLRRAQRRYGPTLTSPRSVVAAALLITVACTVVGIAVAATSSASSYGVQSRELRQHGGGHLHSTSTATENSCGVACQAQRATLAAHVRGLTYATGVLLVTNLVLVGWVLALSGGRLSTTAPATPATRPR